MSEEVFCTHEQWAYRRKQNYGGTYALRRQCQSCGYVLPNAVSKKEVIDFDSIPMVDDVLKAKGEVEESAWLNARWEAEREEKRIQAEAEYAQKQAALKAEREEENAQWWESYKQYLASQRWAQKKRKVHERANGLCEGCRERPPYQIHHMTYAHVGDELLFELVALCHQCHQKIHPHREIAHETA